jgi:hypothetical protein
VTAVALESLRLEDYSDRELLLVINDTADEDGWVDALELATRLGLEGDYPRRAVASRLSWLHRYGAVQREHERDESGVVRYHRDGRVRYTQRWGLTEAGLALAIGQLRKGDESALERLKDEQMILVTRWVQERSHRNGGATMAKLVEREWKRADLLRKG